MLLVILPLTSRFIDKKYKLDVLTKDLYLSRASILIIVAANVLMALSASGWLLAASLIVFGLGSGFPPQVRALLAGLVEPHLLATLNTTIATVETLMGLVSVPALGWLLAKAIALGGFWMGLPFVMTTFCVVLSTIAMFVFKSPHGLAPSEGHYRPVDGHVGPSIHISTP